MEKRWWEEIGARRRSKRKGGEGRGERRRWKRGRGEVLYITRHSKGKSASASGISSAVRPIRSGHAETKLDF